MHLAAAVHVAALRAVLGNALSYTTCSLLHPHQWLAIEHDFGAALLNAKVKEF
jgi:hypothetical protein